MQQVCVIPLQLWRRYLTGTKVSFLEKDVDCARKHKRDIEAVAKGRVFVGAKHAFFKSQKMTLQSKIPT
jgi:hypothetical protein